MTKDRRDLKPVSVETGGPAQIWRPWSDLTPTERRQRSDTAAWATFQRLPVSIEAHSLVSALLTDLLLPAKLEGRKTRLRPKSHSDLEAATGIILADLLVAAASGWAVRRSVRKEAFKGERISRTDWADVMAPMRAAGLVDYADGQWAGEGNFGASRAAVMSATPSLVSMGSLHGVELATIGRHFRSERLTGSEAPRGTLESLGAVRAVV